MIIKTTVGYLENVIDGLKITGNKDLAKVIGDYEEEGFKFFYSAHRTKIIIPELKKMFRPGYVYTHEEDMEENDYYLDSFVYYEYGINENNMKNTLDMIHGSMSAYIYYSIFKRDETHGDVTAIECYIDTSEENYSDDYFDEFIKKKKEYDNQRRDAQSNEIIAQKPLEALYKIMPLDFDYMSQV